MYIRMDFLDDDSISSSVSELSSSDTEENVTQNGLDEVTDEITDVESRDVLMSDLQLSPDKNWVPADIKTTSSKEDEITFIHTRSEKPETYPLRLATITLNVVMDVLFNLKVMGLHLAPDNEVVSVKCEQVCNQGDSGFPIKTRPIPKKKKEKKKKKKNKGRKDQADFYNQCTIKVRPFGGLGEASSGGCSVGSGSGVSGLTEYESELATKELNLKFFNNGKIGVTGVKKITEADQAIRVALEHLNHLSGSVIYYPKKVEYGNPKNFKKKLKQRKIVLEYISDNSGVPVDWDEFIDGIITTVKDPQTGREPYPNGIPIAENVGHNLTFYDILSTYFDLDFLKYEKKPAPILKKIMDNPRFTQWFDRIKNGYLRNSVPMCLEEYQITVDYLAADKNRKIPMDQLCLYLQTEYDVESVAVILRYYFWRNTDLSWEKIEYFFPPEKVEKISAQLHGVDGVGGVDSVKSGENSWKDFSKKEVDLLFLYFSTLTKKKLGIKELQDSDEEDSDVYEEREVYEYYRDQIQNSSRFYLKDLPVWSNTSGRTCGLVRNCYSEDKIDISNINTLFRFNFTLDKLLLKDILIKKYDERNIFKEDTYGGMKFQFLTNIDCPLHQHLDRRTELKEIKITPEYDGCLCKDVSILIFPNVILITGGRSFRQILHSYHFIKNVLLTNFIEILDGTSSQNSPLDKYPNIVSSGKHVFLKKKFVLDNPRNQFILSKTKLINIFSKIDQRNLFSSS